MHQPENMGDIVSGAIIPVLLWNADVWFMFIPKKDLRAYPGTIQNRRMG